MKHPILIALAVAAMTVAALGGCTFTSDNGTSGDSTTDESGVTSEGTDGPDTPDTSNGTDADPIQPAIEVLQPVGARVEEMARLNKPVAFAVRPGDDDVFIAEQGGRVFQLKSQTGNPLQDDIRNNGKPFRVITRPILDISADVRNQGEQGLLGMDFSPDGRRLFVHYSDVEGNTQVLSYALNATGADLATRKRVYSTAQPGANHNGGQLTFGPDGYLYLGLGDGGGSGDPDNNAQNPGTTLGSVLRIDPDGTTDGQRYQIPPGNPFATSGGAPEVWLFGVRNPWRFSFDRLTGDLWLADVGGGQFEEVNLLPAQQQGAGRGANLGWPLLEGTFRRVGGVLPGQLTDPLYTYEHDGRCAVTGGFVYRGSAIEALQGTYVFGDYCSAEILGLRAVDGNLRAIGPIGVNVDKPVSFGQDNAGELWILSHDGPVYRLVAGQ